jgi:hypothetical protein
MNTISSSSQTRSPRKMPRLACPNNLYSTAVNY